MIEPILEEISKKEYYEYTKEDKYDRNPQYIKQACYELAARKTTSLDVG